MKKMIKTEDWKTFHFEDWKLVNFKDKKLIDLKDWNKIDGKLVHLGNGKWVNFDNWKLIDLNDWKLIDLNDWKLVDLNDGKLIKWESKILMNYKNGKWVNNHIEKFAKHDNYNKKNDNNDKKSNEWENVSGKECTIDNWNNWKLVLLGNAQINSTFKNLQLIDQKDPNNWKLVNQKDWGKDGWKGKKFYDLRIEPEDLVSDNLKNIILTHQQNLEKDKLKNLALINWIEKKYVKFDGIASIDWEKQDVKFEGRTRINWNKLGLEKINIINVNSDGFADNKNCCILVNEKKKTFVDPEDWIKPNNWELVNFRDWNLIEITRSAEKELIKRFHERANEYSNQIETNQVESNQGDNINEVLKKYKEEVVGQSKSICIKDFIKAHYTIKVINNEIIFINKEKTKENKSEELKPDQHSSNNTISDTELIKLYDRANEEIINRLRKIAISGYCCYLNFHYKDYFKQLFQANNKKANNKKANNKKANNKKANNNSADDNSADDNSADDNSADSNKKIIEDFTEELSNYYYNLIIAEKKFKKKSNNVYPASFKTYIIVCKIDDKFMREEKNQNKKSSNCTAQEVDFDKEWIEHNKNIIFDYDDNDDDNDNNDAKKKEERLYSPYELQMICSELLASSDNSGDYSSDTQPESVANVQSEDVADKNSLIDESSDNPVYDTWLLCMRYYNNSNDN